MSLEIHILIAIVAIMFACHIDNFVLIRVNKTWSAIHKYVCFAIYILDNRGEVKDRLYKRGTSLRIAYVLKNPTLGLGIKRVELRSSVIQVVFKYTMIILHSHNHAS